MRGTAMLWPRDTCPFGLPDDVDLGGAPVGEVLLAAIGHVLRTTAADIVEAPLPIELASLLRRLSRPQRTACHTAIGRDFPRAARRKPAPSPADRKRAAAGHQNMPSANLASSDMRSLSQGGSNVSFTETWPTPATPATAFSTQVGISPATGQPGAVSVISTATLRSSSTSIL